jgi:dTMP kinase
MTHKGLFISVEGIDGAGKSTHIDAVAHAFTQAGRTVVRTREPGGTPLAEALRQLVLHEAMDALTEALLVFAARRDHVVQVIMPALAAGAVVISDRFVDASFAYQGGGRGLPWQTLQFLEHATLIKKAIDADSAQGAGVLLPHLTLWFDLPAPVAAQRLSQARLPDRFEAQPLAFFAAVAEGYRQRAQADPTRFARIDADQIPAAVAQQVMAAIAPWLAKVGQGSP